MRSVFTKSLAMSFCFVMLCLTAHAQNNAMPLKAMTTKPITSMILFDETKEGYHKKFSASINEKNELVFESYERGKALSEAYGDSDYEAWTSISPEYKDSLLLNLLKDRFKSDAELKAWCTEKGIPFRVVSF